MRIGIPLSPFGELKPSGLGIFNKNIVLELIRQRVDYSYVIYLQGDEVDVSPFNEFPNVEIIYIAKSPFWKDIAVWRGRRSVDVWLFTNPSYPWVLKPGRSCVTVLDFGVHEERLQLSWRQKFLLKLLYMTQKRAIQNATAILSVSESTSSDMHRLFPNIKNKNIFVTGCGYTPISGPISINSNSNSNSNYYLMVGAIKPRKNQLTAVKAFIKAKELGVSGELRIVGSGGGEYLEKIKQLASQSRFKEEIIFEGFCPQEKLEDYYRNARALIFPSHTEGFGMAILEAMSCGVPVISSSNSGQGEVANGYAVTADSSDVDGFAHAILKLQDPVEREKLSKLSLQRAKDFSWQKTAAKYHEVISLIG